MKRLRCNAGRGLKMALLAGGVSGMVWSSSCSVVDIKHNLVAGTQSFVRSYATGLLEALLPAPEALIGGGGAVQ